MCFHHSLEYKKPVLDLASNNQIYQNYLQDFKKESSLDLKNVGGKPKNQNLSSKHLTNFIPKTLIDLAPYSFTSEINDEGAIGQKHESIAHM